MNRSRQDGIAVALLLLAVVSVLAMTWTGGSDALAADDTALWSSSDVLAQIQPGLVNEELRQTAEGELERIREALGSQSINYAHERAFRVYSLISVDIINMFEEMGSLGDCISTDYRWHIPLVSGGLTTGTAKLAADKDGAWHVASYGTAQLQEYTLLTDLSKISKVLTIEGLTNVTDIKVAYLPLYRTTMLYIKADGQEYAMAVSEARFTDIAMGKIYTAKDFVAAFEAAFGKPVPFKGPLEDLPIGVKGSKAE